MIYCPEDPTWGSGMADGAARPGEFAMLGEIVRGRLRPAPVDQATIPLTRKGQSNRSSASCHNRKSQRSVA